jgi:hypothetical protein
MWQASIRTDNPAARLNAKKADGGRPPAEAVLTAKNGEGKKEQKEKRI